METRPTTKPSQRGDLAVVLTGGGARAAYQVGVLRAIFREIPDFSFQIVTGVSAGAINAVYLACRPLPIERLIEDLVDIWTNITTEDVFRSDVSLLRNLTRWGLRLISGGSSAAPKVQGLLDTAPLERLLREIFRAPGQAMSDFDVSLACDTTRTLAITTFNYNNGQTITWVQGSKEIRPWARPNRLGIRSEIGVEHVMASSALPLIFPAIRIGRQYFGDGGIRLAAPLSPAIHLGATRILAMSTRYTKSWEEANEPKSVGYPPPVQVAGHLMNAVFLDLIDQDAMRLEMINRLLERIPEHERNGLRPIDLVVMRPSVDLGRLAGEFEIELPKGFRFLLRGTGTRETRSPDFLSLLLFEPEYLSRLIQIGEQDALARMDEIRALAAS